MRRLGLFLAVFAMILGIATVDAQARKRFISIGTGGTGGVYYPYGGALAEIWTRYVKDVYAVAEVTGASVENVKLVNRGESEVAEVMGDVAYEAYYGLGRFKGKRQKIYALFVMYPNVYHVVTLKNSGIKKLQDLKGKRVSVGAPGSGTEYMSSLVLPTVGVPYESFKVYRLSFVETANALKDGTIDAGVWCVGPPTSSIMDLATTHHIYIVPFSDEEVKKVTSKYKYYSRAIIPAGTYKGVDYDVQTVSVWNVAIVNKDLPEDLVYQLVKAVFEHQDYLLKVYPGAKYTVPENIVKYSPIPLHPGVVKYLREKGIEVPERLLPKD